MSRSRVIVGVCLLLACAAIAAAGWRYAVSSRSAPDRPISPPAKQTAAAAQPPGKTGKASNVERPNVIWILLDACRSKNLSCYGNPRPSSPAMDGLAQRGVIFEQAFAQSTSTNYSVPSYMTGRYFPVASLSDRFSRAIIQRSVPEHEVLIGTTMKANGYRTVFFDAHPMIEESDRLSKSFEEFIKLPWSIGKGGVPNLESLNARFFSWVGDRRDVPFFAYIHAMDIHFPIFLSAPYDQWIDRNYSTDCLEAKDFAQSYVRRDGQHFAPEDCAYFNALYDGAILYADTQIGKLIQHLKDLGILDNTIFIVSADHGQALGEDGFFVGHSRNLAYDELLQVPLLMAGPGIPAGIRINALVENVDIVPTLVDLLGLETDAQYDGKSLMALARGSGNDAGREFVFSAPDRGFYDEPISFEIRGREFQYQEFLTGPERHVWKMPYRYDSPNDVASQVPDKLAELQDRLNEKWGAYWRDYQRLPQVAVTLDAGWIASFCTSGGPIEGALMLPVKPQRLRVDNKWACSDGALWCSCAEEECPALQIRFPVPPGTYRAHIKILNDASCDGHPASSVLVHLRGASEAVKIQKDDAPHETAHFEAVSLGQYEAPDGMFEFTLAGADREHWACVQKFILIPTNDLDAGNADLVAQKLAPEPVQAVKSAEDALRALGYL